MGSMDKSYNLNILFESNVKSVFGRRENKRKERDRGIYVRIIHDCLILTNKIDRFCFLSFQTSREK